MALSLLESKFRPYVILGCVVALLAIMDWGGGRLSDRRHRLQYIAIVFDVQPCC